MLTWQIYIIWPVPEQIFIWWRKDTNFLNLINFKFMTLKCKLPLTIAQHLKYMSLVCLLFHSLKLLLYLLLKHPTSLTSLSSTNSLHEKTEAIREEISYLPPTTYLYAWASPSIFCISPLVIIEGLYRLLRHYAISGCTVNPILSFSACFHFHSFFAILYVESKC